MIVVTVPSAECNLEVGPQTPSISIVDLTNIAGNGTTTREVEARSTVTGITYTSTNPAKACGASGTRGSYEGKVLLHGLTFFGVQQGIWIA